MKVHDLLLRANACKRVAAALSNQQKNRILNSMADALTAEADAILEANRIDCRNAAGRLSDVMMDRLRLTDARISDMADGIRAVATLPDPIGRTLEQRVSEDGLTIEKRSVPLGVVAIIYESRPNVTSDTAALCLKSGNVCVLRSGRDAILSSGAIVTALRHAIASAGFSEDLVSLIDDTDHRSADELMTAVGLVDLLIPRGGAGLISRCVGNAKVPVLQTGTGICHIYVDRSADLPMALSVLENAKTSRPSVCNAAEVCLVHEQIADVFLPLLQKRLVDDRMKQGLQPVELRCDERSYKILGSVPASEHDFDTEFLDYILAIAVVSDVDGAIDHIARHSTGHSEAIIAEDEAVSQHFTDLVDSAAVYVNASTRFTDGGKFGLGCEIGISTQKLHARGPMGLAEMTSYKYVIRGNGQIRTK